MSNCLTPAEQIRHALTVPTRGIIGLVDELLSAPWEHKLQLDWQAGRCRVRLGIAPSDLIEMPVPKSVIRAALARIAVLCNKHMANSVSPFGGQGELSLGNESTDVLQVTFANTPDEQSLEVVRRQPAGVASEIRNGIPTARGSS